MNKDEIIEALEAYCTELVEIRKKFKPGHRGMFLEVSDSARFQAVVTELSHLFQDHLPKFNSIPSQLAVSVANGHRTTMCVSVIEVERIVRPYILRIARQPSNDLTIVGEKAKETDLFLDLQRLIERFDAVARQLAQRYDGRNTLLIDDEYDAQDLFRSLLTLYFKDVRPEQSGPSHIGGSARVDFVLPEIETYVELKKMRASLTTKALGEQIIVDISRYRAHGGCRRIVFFIYDPEYLVKNPAGLESDVEKESGEMDVRIFISPRR